MIAESRLTPAIGRKRAACGVHCELANSRCVLRRAFYRVSPLEGFNMHQHNRLVSTSIAFVLAAGAMIAACSSDNSPATGAGGSAGTGTGGKGGASGAGGKAANGGNSGTTNAGAGGVAGEAGAAPTAGAAGEGGEGGGSAIEAYVATLSGAEEVPPVDTAAAGTATFTYDPATHELDWTLEQNVTGATLAHIHDGAGGESGPIIVNLVATSPASGTATLTADQETELRLGHLYANVHSPAAPAGEIRGQILRPGDTLWVARLTGAEEVPSNASTGTGVSSVVVNADHTSAHYRLTTTLTPTLAHIHTGIAGVSGAVRIPFTLAGMAAEADVAFTEADFTALQQTQLYANVHTTAFAAGEIRGQLLPAGSTLFAARLTGDQEVPAVTTTGTGNASVTLAYRSSDVRYAVVTSLTPSASHIHDAVYGVSGPVILPFTPLGTEMYGTGTLPAGEADALRAGKLYANVHTTANPGGEIRGQLIQPGEHLYSANLLGASEVPPVTSAATGHVEFVLNAAGNSLRYSSVVTGLVDATAAHIHAGAVGVAGPIVYPLTLVGLTPTGTQTVTPADVIALNAMGYYANIHSTAQPAGEIRGQIIAH
jgi:CHRD domain